MLAAVCPSPQIDASRIGEGDLAEEPGDVLAVRQPREELDLPLRADPARHALAARLVGEELGAPPDDVQDVGRLVEHDDGARPDRGAARAEAFGAQREVQVPSAQHGRRRAAALDRAQPVAGRTPPARSSSARSVVPDGTS